MTGAALPVVLIGPMGAGKSSVGRGLAARLGVPFHDTDAIVVAEHGAIDAIFAEQGESRFRELEREAVRAATRERAVVALGGGAVLHPETRRELGAMSVVLLSVDRAGVAPRLQGARRPLIEQGGLEAWERIARERRPLYAALARVEIDTTDRSVEELVEEIVERLGLADATAAADEAREIASEEEHGDD